MSYDLEYFTEFLEDPSAPDIGEFYEMLTEWAGYVREHRDEFDYLADDEWKEIRERLIAEVGKRDSLRKVIEVEWEESCRILEDTSQASDDEVLEALKTQLRIIRTYRKLHDFADEEISLLENHIADFSEKIRDAQIAEENARMAQIALEKSIINLDESLANYQERTGKTPVLPNYRDKKVHKGN
jgi:hypothetical protein